MRKFWLGCVTSIAVLLLAGFAYVRLGFVNPRADIPINALDRAIAMPALDASVDRRAPKLRNPVSPTEANLVAGMAMYQKQCASCHGDPLQHDAMLANSLYPRPPQFMKEAPDMPENQNFYILLHGIRYSGMPAWKQTYNERQIWQIATFLSHMDKLPPAVLAQWQTAAGASPSGAAASETHK